MYRFNAYNEGNFYRALPFFRQFVVPGQTITVETDLRVQTGAFDRNLLNGGVLNAYFFFVPFRLIWDQWPEFVAREDGAVSAVPTTTTAFPGLFERTGTFNVFARRAYKLIYNQYFGSSAFGKEYVVNTDTDATFLPLRTVDQLLTRVIPDGEITAATLDAPVTGTAPNQVAEIPLNLLRQELRNAKSTRRAQMTGDKYVDAMARMGVDLGWSVQMAPEFIGGMKKTLEPRETKSAFSATGGITNTGAPYANFKEQCSIKSKKVYCAEHGIVLGLVAVRPLDFKENFRATLDSQIVTTDNFFFGDNQEGTVSFDLATLYGVNSQPVQASRFSYLTAGCNAVGNKSSTALPWVTEDVAVSVNDAVYPPGIDLASPQLDNLVAVSGMSRSYGASKVRTAVF